MPIIPITITLSEKRLDVEALIDSGANRCFCQIEIGEFLNVQLASCSREPVSGVGGSAEVFIHKVKIDIEHGVYILPAEMGFGHFNFHGFSCILGQKDFFENVDVLFQRRKGQIVLQLS
jgi:hypothetical protein